MSRYTIINPLHVAEVERVLNAGIAIYPKAENDREYLQKMLLDRLVEGKLPERDERFFLLQCATKAGTLTEEEAADLLKHKSQADCARRGVALRLLQSDETGSEAG